MCFGGAVLFRKASALKRIGVRYRLQNEAPELQEQELKNLAFVHV